MIDGEVASPGIEQAAKVIAKPLAEVQPDQAQRKSVIASRLQLPTTKPDDANEQRAIARDTNLISDALSQNVHITEDTMPAYTAKAAELYTDFGLGVREIAGASLEDMEAAQAIFERYKAEFPSGYFKGTVVSLLPKLLEKGQDPAQREQAIQATFGLLHQYEPVVKARVDETTDKFKALHADLKAASDTDMIDQQYMDWGSGKMVTRQISKKDSIKQELEYFSWPDTEYRQLQHPLEEAPTIEHYTDAVTTIRDINEATGTFHPYFLDSYAHIFKDSPSIDNVRNMNQLLRRSALLDGDPSQIIVRGGNIWAVGKENGTGAADLAYKALTTETTPLGLHEVLAYARQVPGTSVARFEQNRKDALALSGTFGNLRDYIHDQWPDVHDVISSMLEYHETGNQEALEGFVGKYNSPDRSAHYLDGKLLLDRDSYARQSQDGESVVDILKRLKENTAPVQDLPAQTGRTELDENMRLLQAATEHHQGTVDLFQLDKALTQMNVELAAMQANKQVGVEPNFVLATSWLEHKTFEALQQRVQGAETNHEIAELHKQHWFGESIKLFLRTNSATPVTNEDIDGFVQSVQAAPTPEAAYKAVMAKTTETVEHLSFYYKAQGKDTGALWSGNLADAYIMLSDSYTPSARLHRAQETIQKLSQARQEAEEVGQKPISEFIEMPPAESEMHPLQPGADPNVDSLYQLYKSTSGKSVLELPAIQQQHKGSWEIGSIVKALRIHGKPIQYGDEATPIQYIADTVNGRQVQAVLLDEAGLALGSVTVDGVPIQDKNELINKLGLPAIYKSVTREGD